jgi:hypothetical protein
MKTEWSVLGRLGPRCCEICVLEQKLMELQGFQYQTLYVLLFGECSISTSDAFR